MSGLKIWCSVFMLALMAPSGCADCEDSECITDSDDPIAPGGLQPIRQSQWHTVVDAAFDASAVTELTIGGTESSDNFVARGDVEVYFSDTGGRIVVQQREFTFATDDAGAAADFDLLQSWVYPASSPAPPVQMGQRCDAGETFEDRCHVRVYWQGQVQKLRAGADTRVFLPAAWAGRLNVVAEDNMTEGADYPDRSDVTILGLRGKAFIEVESGRVDVRLASDAVPVPACTPEANAECLALGWPATEGCAMGCTDFGRVEVRTRGQQAAQVRVDAPASLWMTAKLENTLPGLLAEDGCSVQVGAVVGADVGAGGICGSFGACECHDCDPALTFRRRVEVNRPGPDAIAGLGFSVDLQSGDCTEIAFVEGPEDYLSTSSEHRGQLELCAGCLDGVASPAIPAP
jgi:hypothetical protein